MSILCCHTPDFLFSTSALAHPEWREQPVALLGADERVWCASPLARSSGVSAGLTARQARSRCPDALLPALDLAACEAHQSAFVSVLTQTGLTTEVQGYGAAYVDLSPVTTSPGDAAPVCAQLGKQVRDMLGAPLQPAVGCDSGKFTARAAAQVARAGRMRVVDKVDEARFLGPLPVTLLPLPLQTLHYLHWLGLNTLAQFAALKVADATERFGKAGALAQRWASGHDDRPVRPTLRSSPEPITVDFDSPTTSRDLALDMTLRALRPHLRRSAHALEGCRKLHVELTFLGGARRFVTCPFVTPLCDAQQMRAGLSQALGAYAWGAELVQLNVTLLDIAELQPMQLMLFDDERVGLDKPVTAPKPFTRLVEALGLRYPGAFSQAQVTDARHAVRERRFQWTPA